MIHIVISVFNRWHYTKLCIDSLLKQTYIDFKIIVVDHGSSDGTSEFIKKGYPTVVLLKGNESMWWTAATNVGVKYALENNADYVLTLNNDLTVKSNYLNQLMMAMEQHPNSILGSVSVDSRNHDKVCFAGVTWNKWTAKYIQNVNEYSTLNEIKNQERLIITDLLPGRGTLIPIEAFKIVGVYNEKTFPHYAADEHFSLSCKKSGFQLFIVPNAIVYSEVEATGLKNIYKSKNRKYWIDLFSSRRSAVNLKTRWNWAKYNTPIPPLYFIFDLARIVGSQLKSK